MIPPRPSGEGESPGRSATHARTPRLGQPYISPRTALYLPYISPISPLHLPRLGQPVLAYLVDVKTSSQLGGGKQGFQLAFVFAENPYFTDKVLTKTYLMDPDDEEECLERAVGDIGEI